MTLGPSRNVEAARGTRYIGAIRTLYRHTNIAEVDILKNKRTGGRRVPVGRMCMENTNINGIKV